MDKWFSTYMIFDYGLTKSRIKTDWLIITGQIPCTFFVNGCYIGIGTLPIWWESATVQ